MTFEEREHIIEKLFKRNYEKLHLYATYLLSDGESARDLVSDAFVKLLESEGLPKATEKELESYIFIMVRNRCMDVFRHQEVEHDYLEMSKLAETITWDNYDEYDERLQKVLKLIEEMPPQARFVFEQCYLNDRKYADVANAMGISVDGVKKQVVRGLAKIREYFNVNYRKS